MTNTNCLEIIKCPACGNEESFRFAARTIATVTDDGVDDYGDMEWDDESYAECAACLRHGTLKDFSGRVSGPVPAATEVPSRFDAYEVHGVYEFSDDGRTFCEQVPDDELMLPNGPRRHVVHAVDQFVAHPVVRKQRVVIPGELRAGRRSIHAVLPESRHHRPPHEEDDPGAVGRGPGVLPPLQRHARGGDCQSKGIPRTRQAR